MILAKLAAHMDKEEISKAVLAVKTGLSVETIENARKGKSVSHSTYTLIIQALKLKKGDLVEKEEAA